MYHFKLVNGPNTPIKDNEFDNFCDQYLRIGVQGSNCGKEGRGLNLQ